MANLGLQFIPYTLKFNFTARTSRGSMREINTVLIRVQDQTGNVGWGECILLPGLSLDDGQDYTELPESLINELSGIALDSEKQVLEDVASLVPPGLRSLKMGMETALLDLLNGGHKTIFQSPFSSGEPLKINGLIWMGHSEFMLQQISERIYEGFTCIKMKIGGIDFDTECDILDYVRRRYFKDGIMIKLDANGSLKGRDTISRLQRLSAFDIHSIEQPLPAGDADMAELVHSSPIPIALDEELIAPEGRNEKQELLERIKPPFIVLKPSLLGGFRNTAEYIEIAEEMGIGWWITSSLESNIGLNAICQFTSRYKPEMPQGLGTGRLYENNFPSPLKVVKGTITNSGRDQWDIPTGPEDENGEI